MLIYILIFVKRKIEFRTKKNYNGAVSKKIIFFFILLALAIRLFPGPDKFIFTYDQARDAFISRQIIENRDLKIIGPSTEVQGAHHGPLYYYFLSPFYSLSKGDPNMALIFTLLINILTLIPLTFLAQKLFKNKAITCLSLLLFALSFEQHSYARWLSNPSPAVFFLTIFQLGLWLILIHPNHLWGWFLAALGLTAAIHHQLFLLFALPVAFSTILLLGKLPRTFKPYLVGGITLLAGFSTFLIAELKFGFQATKGFFNLLINTTASQETATEFLRAFLIRLSQVVMHNTLNINQPLGFTFFFFCLVIIVYFWKKLTKKDRLALSFLFILIFSQAILFLFSETIAAFITIGMATPIIILTSFCLVSLFKRQRFLALSLISLIILTNLNKIISQNRFTTPIFAIQENMTLENEKKVIDACYRLTENQPFGINTITNPLFINTTWAYLFQWYAQPKYHFLPVWTGISQEGNLGSEVFPQDKKEPEIQILIIEPTSGVPEIWVEAALKEENLHSEIEKEEKVDQFVVQVRKRLSEEREEERLKEVSLLKNKNPDALSPAEKAFLHAFDLRLQNH